MSERYLVRTHHRSMAMLSVGLLLLVVVLSRWMPGPGMDAAETTVEASPQALVTATQPAADDEAPVDGSADETDAIEPTTVLTSDERANAIDAELEGYEGLFGVVMIDESRTTVYQENAEVPFLSASLYKLVLMADILAGIEEGVLAEDTEVPLLGAYFPAEGEYEDSYFPTSWVDRPVPITELLFATGAYSSNVAANALRSLTTTGDLDAMADSLGMTGTILFADPGTSLAWPPEQPAGVADDVFALAVSIVEEAGEEGPVSVTTPGDVAMYFERLLAGTVSSTYVSAEIMAILNEQVVVDRIPFLLPADTEVTHKTGNLDHVVHDAGIIWTPRGPVVLVVMIENAPDDLIAIEIIQRLALIAYGEPVQIDIDAATL